MSKKLRVRTDPFADSVERQRTKALQRIRSVRIAVLIWGPTPRKRTAVAKARRVLRQALESDGHLVRYSEDLYDPKLRFSLLAQQVADVEAHDITFSLPDSEGSIAEIHDFARIPGVSHNIVAFIDSEKSDGYSNTTLQQLQTTATCKVHFYRSCELPDAIVGPARLMVERLQEFYYLIGRPVGMA